MFRMRTIMVFTANILLALLSWIFYKYPQGDEYLVLFMISMIFMAAPGFIAPRNLLILYAGNLFFFCFYYVLGALNVIDIITLATLLAACSAAAYVVRGTYRSFLEYQKKNMMSEERKYNSIVNELETIDRRGRKIENELHRISRLYEVTKQLAPVLKFKDLLEALFGFLIENFRFETTHLLTLNNGQFSKGFSRSVKYPDYSESEDIFKYGRFAEYCETEGFKPFFLQRSDDKVTFEQLNIRAQTLMAFPVLSGENITAILVIEGATRSSYGRFRILLPQIALEIRKVELYEQVQELSIVDGLTEVFLRRYLMGRLEEEVDRAGRLGLTFSLGMVDVDHFKRCNDQYGHLVGDTVLKKIAERLKSSVREVDMIARYGGEEFCIVLPETPKDQATTVAERLRKSVCLENIKAFDEDLRMTVSVGIATYPEDARNVEDLIEKADTALYRAKRKGRNRVFAA
ncbi:MAG: diguanylate cyclase [Candidatus Omnitrophica bacterium]|nr:diguanylate cyclase [Candidatus Omnitrophota bacterium]